MTLATLLIAAAVATAPPQAPMPPAPPAPPGGPHMGGPRGPHAPGPPHGGLHAKLFPPELIMQHQAEIGLSKDQRKKLVKEIKATQGQIVELQFELKAAEGVLGKLVEADRVDEGKALAQSDRVMAMEQKIKRNHLQLLIRIKNILTPTQRKQLDQLRPRPRHRGPGKPHR